MEELERLVVFCRTAGYRGDDFTDECKREALEVTKEVQLSQEKVVLSRPRYVRVELKL